MKNLLKPFSYTLVASAIAMAFSQPVFASNIQSNTNQQQPRNLNKNKGKPVTNIQQQSKKPMNRKLPVKKLKMNVNKLKQLLLPK